MTIFLYNEINRHTNFQIYSGTELYMFRAVSVPIIRSFSLYIRHWYMSWRFDDSFQARPGPKFILVKKFSMFRAVSLPIIRSFPLYIWHWHMLYRFDDN